MDHRFWDLNSLYLLMFFAAPLIVPWFVRSSKKSCWITYGIIVAMQISVVIAGFWYLEQQYLSQSEGAVDGPVVFVATLVNALVVLLSAGCGLFSTVAACHYVAKK